MERKYGRRRLLGRWGERAAACYLTLAGYRILARNWRCRRGEIDIVARKGRTVVFVEVRTRRRGALVDPLLSVDLLKISRIMRTAKVFLASRGMSLEPCRFDVVALTVSPWGLPRLRHVRRAFDGSTIEASGTRAFRGARSGPWSRG